MKEECTCNGGGRDKGEARKKKKKLGQSHVRRSARGIKEESVEQKRGGATMDQEKTAVGVHLLKGFDSHSWSVTRVGLGGGAKGSGERRAPGIRIWCTLLEGVQQRGVRGLAKEVTCESDQICSMQRPSSLT